MTNKPIKYNFFKINIVHGNKYIFCVFGLV